VINHPTITVLVDNRSDDSRLYTEHGLSLWIEADGRRIIFDTGQSDILFRNAETLGIDLRKADTLVLSHGHYDHTGGVARLLEINPALQVYCHPGIFIPRYSRQADGRITPIGLREQNAKALLHHIDGITWTTQPVFLSKEIGITGPIPRRRDFEDTGGAFFLDPEAQKPDPIEDDCAMWFMTSEGVTVVTGCSHSGLVNTLEHIRSFTGERHVGTVIGGLHLLHASEERIEETCRYLQSAGIGRIVPCHCTGERTVEYLQQWFGTLVVNKGQLGSVRDTRLHTGRI
jgi:7,8-dihydropterin-6-yl-methyl-4-(beta-D-ribofuranosyl)aminobenzene 5'-phosphate synthase